MLTSLMLLQISAPAINSCAGEIHVWLN